MNTSSQQVPTAENTKLSEKTWFHVLWIALCFPVGVYLIARTKRYSKAVRFGPLAVIGLGLVLSISAFAFSSPEQRARARGKSAFEEIRRSQTEAQWLSIRGDVLAQQALKRNADDTWTEAQKTAFLRGFDEAYQNRLVDDAVRDYKRSQK